MGNNVETLGLVGSRNALALFSGGAPCPAGVDVTDVTEPLGPARVNSQVAAALSARALAPTDRRAREERLIIVPVTNVHDIDNTLDCVFLLLKTCE